MEQSLMPHDDSSDHGNLKSPQNDKSPQINQLSQQLTGGNMSMTSSPYSSSDQEDKMIVMEALFQLHQQSQKSPQQQQGEQEQHSQQQFQQQIQQQQQYNQQKHSLQHQLQQEKNQPLQEQQHVIQQQLERDQQQKELIQLQRMQNENFDQLSNASSPWQEEMTTEQRYRSTMTALEAAGLLDLTLKTSELAQQNEAFDRDLRVFENVVMATYDAVKGDN